MTQTMRDWERRTIGDEPLRLDLGDRDRPATGVLAHIPPVTLGPEVGRADRDRRLTRAVVIGAVVAALGVVALLVSLLTGGSGGGATPDLADAVQLQSDGRGEEAAAIYEDVLVADPGNVVARFNLGVIDHTGGDAAAAARAYEQALAIDPSYVPALFNLAVLRAEAGDTEAAVELYRRVLTAEPDRAPAMLNLGLLLLEQGDEDEASQLLGQAVQLDPSLQTIAG